MDDIQQVIRQGEKQHEGEICFAVEARLPLRSLLAGHRARARAEDLFGQLRVWDTTRRTGVLIYVLLADHAVEIVADRGAALRLPPRSWDIIAQQMRKHFGEDDWRRGALAGIKAINALLARHLPAAPGGHPNELPNKPIVL